jgi:hypothetical protein
MDRFSQGLHRLLLGVADEKLREGEDDEPLRWSMVIVEAGSACDVAAAHALRCMQSIDRHRSQPNLGAGESRKLDALLKSRKVVNLKPKAQRALWKTMSGDKLSRWPDWIRYLRLVDRRDSITRRGCVPGGRPAAYADAAEAVEVAWSFLEHLDRVTAGLAVAAG